MTRMCRPPLSLTLYGLAFGLSALISVSVITGGNPLERPRRARPERTNNRTNKLVRLEAKTRRNTAKHQM